MIRPAMSRLICLRRNAGGLSGKDRLGRGRRRLRRLVVRPWTYGTAAADRLDMARPLLLEDALQALDRITLAVEQPADALQQGDVIGAVIAPAAAALERLDLVKRVSQKRSTC